MTGTDGPLLEADHLIRTFGSFVAVDDVSLQVHPGEVVGLLGANGAGKTTVIRMLLGLLAPTDGVVALLGGPPSRQARARLGYVPQGLGLYADLTVRENVAFMATTYGTRPQALEGPLSGMGSRLVSDLGLGLQRQLAFLVALQHRPHVLVLDEPTSGVAPLARARLWDTIRDQSEQGVGVLVTTHYMQEAQQCDRLLLMSSGRLVAQGSEADIVAGTTTFEVRSASWAKTFDVLSQAGVSVSLAGTSVRAVDADPTQLRKVLSASGIPAEVTEVKTTIEERMLAVTLAAGS